MAAIASSLERKGIHAWVPLGYPRLIRNLSALLREKGNFLRVFLSSSLWEHVGEKTSGIDREAALIRRTATISIHGKESWLAFVGRRYESARSRGNELVEKLRQQMD